NFVANESMNIIPSTTEQANLLLNVQEVFEQVKLLTKDEAHSTNTSVSEDIQLMVKRAEYTLDLLQQITLLRLSCDGNSICSLDARPAIRVLANKGKEDLNNCTLTATEDIDVSSEQLANTTNAAIDRSQVLLDDLAACSKKVGLAVISCYKGIIATEVVPVKHILLGAIEAHKAAHLKALDIRKQASMCVDEIVGRYKTLLEKELENALRCNL
ncbi:hypothetical protein NQ315_002847, partial [Exocentrus adspersus]